MLIIYTVCRTANRSGNIESLRCSSGFDNTMFGERLHLTKPNLWRDIELWESWLEVILQGAILWTVVPAWSEEMGHSSWLDSRSWKQGKVQKHSGLEMARNIQGSRGIVADPLQGWALQFSLEWRCQLSAHAPRVPFLLVSFDQKPWGLQET